MKRRAFLGAGLAVAGGGAALTVPRWRNNGPFRFFTAAEAATVDAICAQLIPRDRDAGAREAGVVNYIDIQLTRHLKRYQRTYRRGLADVDARSRARFSQAFAALTAAQQVEALTEVEAQSKEFFELILAHTRQGFYGDPRHGGNRGRVSWKMLGLPFPQVRGRMHYGDQSQSG